MTREEEDRATENLIDLGKKIIPPVAAHDPVLAEWLYRSGYHDLLSPEDLEREKSHMEGEKE